MQGGEAKTGHTLHCSKVNGEHVVHSRRVDLHTISRAEGVTMSCG